MKILAGSDYWTKRFMPIASGPELWTNIKGAYSYKFDHPVDCSEEELDYIADLFNSIKEWGEVYTFMHSRREERDAERSLGDLVEDAMGRSIVLMSRRVDMIVTGGGSSDSNWLQAEVQAW
jgi:hypothetical protein